MQVFSPHFSWQAEFRISDSPHWLLFSLLAEKCFSRGDFNYLSNLLLYWFTSVFQLLIIPKYVRLCRTKRAGWLFSLLFNYALHVIFLLSFYILQLTDTRMSMFKPEWEELFLSECICSSNLCLLSPCSFFLINEQSSMFHLFQYRQH